MCGCGLNGKASLSFRDPRLSLRDISELTYRIVQLHDGAIDFSSEPGKGTTFILRLPLSV